jgi:hypothetical protein
MLLVTKKKKKKKNVLAQVVHFLYAEYANYSKKNTALIQ